MVYLIKKLPWGKTFVGSNEIFLEFWSSKSLPGCHHSMGAPEEPLPCLSLSSCQARSVQSQRQPLWSAANPAQPGNVHPAGQSPAHHCSPPFREACGIIYVFYKALRSLTQHMENLWPRLTSNPPAPNLETVLKTVPDARNTLWLFWGRPFAESNSIWIRPKQNWRDTWLHRLLLQMLIHI